MKQQHPVIEIRKLEQFLSNIKVLQELQKTNPKINILKSYQGFGGLKQCFNSKKLYGMLMQELSAIFTKGQEHEVFNSLRNSCKSGYYTPKEVIAFMYNYLIGVCQFTGGDILEPSCGNGAFFTHMPENIKTNSRLTGVELDSLTYKLVKAIYPDISLINAPLQEIDFGNRKYDLIIGNPPYSSEKIIDNLMPDISNYTIHHYFVAKCVRLLKNNGILAFVVPSYYLDIPRNHTRAIVNNEAILLDAVRLPENLFTQATLAVDVIFFRKSGKKLHNFINTVLLEQDGNKDTINEYWHNNPHRVLGDLKLKWIECYQRYIPTCITSNVEQIIKGLANCQFSKKTRQNYDLIIS